MAGTIYGSGKDGRFASSNWFGANTPRFSYCLYRESHSSVKVGSVILMSLGIAP